MPEIERLGDSWNKEWNKDAAAADDDDVVVIVLVVADDRKALQAASFMWISNQIFAMGFSGVLQVSDLNDFVGPSQVRYSTFLERIETHAI